MYLYLSISHCFTTMCFLYLLDVHICAILRFETALIRFCNSTYCDHSRYDHHDKNVTSLLVQMYSKFSTQQTIFGGICIRQWHILQTRSIFLFIPFSPWIQHDWDKINNVAMSRCVTFKYSLRSIITPLSIRCHNYVRG